MIDKAYRVLWQDRIWFYKYNCWKIKHNIQEKNVWLFGTPKSRNLGDEAQTYCTELWLKKNYPGYHFFEYNSVELLYKNCRLITYISKVIKPKDVVFFQSGYNFTDLYPYQEKMHRAVVKRITDNRIVFLPQTISLKKPYAKNKFVEESNSLYENRNNLLLMCRDRVSLEIAESAFPTLKKFAFPDIVTTLIGQLSFSDIERQGVLLCVRNDKEGAFSKEDIDKLVESLSQLGNVEKCDTTIDAPSHCIIRKNRKKYVFEMIERMHSHKVVVTDRYHGLIFSLIAETPVILLKTVDHKITEGLKWLPEEFMKYVHLADSILDVSKIADAVNYCEEEKLPDYFCAAYYDRLFALIEEELCV